jgi:hypothetical protein
LTKGQAAAAVSAFFFPLDPVPFLATWSALLGGGGGGTFALVYYNISI